MVRYGPTIEGSAERLSYLDFIRAKAVNAPELGLSCELGDIHPLLHRHQPVLVKWLVEGGRRARRRGMGVELNPGYFEDGVRILREADRERATPGLFELIEAEVSAEADDEAELAA